MNVLDNLQRGIQVVQNGGHRVVRITMRVELWDRVRREYCRARGIPPTADINGMIVLKAPVDLRGKCRTVSILYDGGVLEIDIDQPFEAEPESASADTPDITRPRAMRRARRYLGGREKSGPLGAGRPADRH